MGGKMDWRRAARRVVQRQPQDQRDRPPTPVAGTWRTILDAMAEIPRTAKAKGRKAALR